MISNSKIASWKRKEQKKMTKLRSYSLIYSNSKLVWMLSNNKGKRTKDWAKRQGTW